MANQLLSIPVAAGTIVLAASGIACACARAKRVLSSDKLALMGIMGAFVFAAQMVQFPLPFMPGTSGHMVGAVLLAIILGPCAGAIVISSVVIIQCMIFQDGGLLALGCNIINTALVPSFLGYYLYRLFTHSEQSNVRVYGGCIIACVTATLAGAALIPVEASISAVLIVPFTTFLFTMLGVHLVIGLMEGVITAAVLCYLKQVRPTVLADVSTDRPRLSRKGVYITLAIATIITAGALSLLADENPDGLEWSYAHRPDNPNFQPMVTNDSKTAEAVDDFHAKLSPMPDYSLRGKTAPGWTSFAGVVGSIITVSVVWLIGHLLKKSSLRAKRI